MPEQYRSLFVREEITTVPSPERLSSRLIFIDRTAAGYPKLATHIANDEKLHIFRNYRDLQVRLILEKQDEMRLIEEDVRDSDIRDNELTTVKCDSNGRRAYASGGRLSTRHRRDPVEAKDRKELFARAERVYKEYGELLTTANQLAMLNKPGSYEWRDLSRFLADTKPVEAREADWIAWREDLISVGSPYQNTLLTALFRLHKPSYAADTSLETQLAAEEYANRVRILIWYCILGLMFSVVLFVPIYALEVVGHDIGKGIGVLFASTVMFILALQTATSARGREIWSSSAA